MVLKKPLTFIEQIHRLKEHNLEIEDIDAALKFSSKVNYYRFT
jgi:abortive infection bacteriophage resistance protein